MRDCSGAGTGVRTQVPPSLSSFNPFTPVSTQGNIPNGVNSAPGSKKISLPSSLTETTLALSRLPSIVWGKKKYWERSETQKPEASNPAARASARNSQVSCTPSPYCFFQMASTLSGFFSLARFCSCSVLTTSKEVLRICSIAFCLPVKLSSAP